MQLPNTSTVVDIQGLVNVGSIPRTSLFGQTINEVTPLIGGAADRGCVVLISIGGAVFGTVANDCGEWSLDTRTEVPLSGTFNLSGDGRKKLVITTIDGDGRSRAIEGVFMVLTASPQVPTLTTARLFRHSPLLSGHAEPGSLVSVTLAGARYLTTVGSNGEWQLDAANQPAAAGSLELGADGRKDVGLICTDLAGNSSKGQGCLMLQSSANMSHIALAEVPRSSDRAVGPRFLGDIGLVLLSAFNARSAGPRRDHKR